MAIAAAGPAANLLLAVIVFAIMLTTIGQPAALPVASRITPDSAAEHAGFKADDRIVTIDGQPVKLFEDLRPTLRANPGKTVRFEVERGGQVLDLFARLGATQEGTKTIGLLGIYSTALTHVALKPGPAIAVAAGKTWEVITDTVTGIAGLVTRGQGVENVAGVVGVAQITSEAASQGFGTLLALLAILSADIALMNLLPIPVLDGGAILFCVAEMVLRRPVSERIQDLTTRTSIAAVASMFMVTTLHDLDMAGLFRWLTQF